MDIKDEIYKEREQGITYPELSMKYGISVAACRRHYDTEKKRRELRNNELFLALQAVNEDEGKNVRVFNMLKRCGVDTVEQFIGLTEQEYIKFRNCGKQAAQIIALAQMYLKSEILRS